MNKTLLGILVAAIASSHGYASDPTIILGRPTDHSITLSVRFMQTIEFSVEYGLHDGITRLTPIDTLRSGESRHVLINGLDPNTRYVYRIRFRTMDGHDSTSTWYSFRTQRPPGTPFKFAITADEHLYDKKGVASLYERTLSNIKQDSVDLLFSLGDTFGDDHTPETTTSDDMDSLHRVYLQYLHPVCSSVPFFFCLGNHEGENGFYLKDSTASNIAVYGTLWRKYYFANPVPDGFYTGNSVRERHGMALPENYYAFRWGDMLFVVLDVYRHCDVDDKPQGWDWTLGVDQYMWLRNTLAGSNAEFKFVFAHHTRGQGRGGISTARGYEWGGWEPNKNRYEFETRRPGWEAPIHELFKRYGVTAFVQGHDHLYAKEELDGVTYQTVPMPSDTTYEIGVSANADAYTDVVRDGSGYLLVSVTPQAVTVDYRRSYLPEHENGTSKVNASSDVSYTLRSRAVSVDETLRNESPSEFGSDNVVVHDVMGRVVAANVEWSVVADRLPHGVYLVHPVTRTSANVTLMVR